MAKFFFSVLVFLECLEEYSKKFFFDSFIFSPQKSCFKVPASSTPNEDGQELLSLGPEQAMTSLQGSWTLYFSVLMFFKQNQSFFVVNNLKND